MKRSLTLPTAFSIITSPGSRAYSMGRPVRTCTSYSPILTLQRMSIPVLWAYEKKTWTLCDVPSGEIEYNSKWLGFPITGLAALDSSAFSQTEFIPAASTRRSTSTPLCLDNSRFLITLCLLIIAVVSCQGNVTKFSKMASV